MLNLGVLIQGHRAGFPPLLIISIFWPGINKAIEEAVWKCEMHIRLQTKNAAAPLTSTPTPSHPWHICALNIFTLNGVDYLILAAFYSKVILVCNLPAGQSNSAKVILILEEWLYDHGTPEVLCTDNDTQDASAAFSDCSIEWGLTYETSSPHYPKVNGFVESCVKIVTHTLQCAKYSGTNPGIALQHLNVTPVDAKLPSPSQMLYNCRICTTVQSRIFNTDTAVLLIQEHLKDAAEQVK